MSWQGFLKESKSYMNYPKNGRLKFWLYYPIALYKYCRIMKGANNG